jgi:hypothetical protein
MYLKVMSAVGPSFDGLNIEEIDVQANITSTNYIATNDNEQYATTGQNMEIIAAAAAPTFTFRNSSGGITGELKAGKVTLTQPSTLITTSGGLTLENNDTSPALIVRKTAGTNKGVAASITTDSNTSATLNLANENTSSNVGLQVLAPNIISTARVQILLGRDTSNTGNSYSLASVYNTVGIFKRFEIVPFGDTEIFRGYRSNSPSTSATTGSVVIPGDLTSSTKVSSKALTLYSSVSGSATLNVPSTIASPYTLTLPNTLGTNGQVLTCGAPSGGVATTSWNDPPLITYSGVYSREITSTQTIGSGGTTGFVIFDAAATVNNTGTIPISVDAGAQYIFRNNASYTTAYQVSYTVVWLANNSGTAGAVKQTWISKNLSFADRYGFSTIGHIPSVSGGIQIAQTQESSATIVLAPNETFGIRIYQNTGASQSISAAASDMTKIQVTQVQGTVPSSGGGIQTVSLTSPSSLFSISGSPTSGLNPTLSFTTSTTPTGTGSQLVLAQSPTLDSTTLTGPTLITGQAIVIDTSIGKFVESPLIQTTSLFGTLTLTVTDGTSYLFRGTSVGYKVVLPQADLIQNGTIYKLNNASTQNINVVTFTNSVLYTISPNQIIHVYLVQNTTTAGVWRIIPQLDSNIRSTSTQFKIEAVPLNLKNTTGTGEISIYPSSTQSTNYNFILPTTIGSSGQALISQGSGQPLSWASVMTQFSTLALTSTGNTITNSSGTLLTLTGNNNLPLAVVNNHTGTSNNATFFAPNLNVGQSSFVWFGKNFNANRNAGYLAYTYQGDASFQNEMAFGFNNSGSGLIVRTPNLPASAGQGTVIVNGGLSASSIHSTGDITTLATLNANAISTGQITTTSKITFDKGSGQLRDLTFDYGSATPTISWGYTGSSDPYSLSYSYEPIYGIGNQHYDWQQVGKQYSFTLQICINITSCATTIPWLFVDNCAPPIPVCGTYPLNNYAGSNTAFPLGLYIPAM